MKTTAIVVARGGSTRVRNKGLREIGGTPMVALKVRQLLAAESIDEVVVGSDSDEILRCGRDAGALTIRRRDYYCDEKRCSANEMIGDMVRNVDCDIVVWAHPTNPLVTSTIYDSAMSAYRVGIEKGHDSLCSVSVIQKHFWYFGLPLGFDPSLPRHQLASELEPVMAQNGAIFIQPREQMIANSYFYGQNPVLFPILSPHDLDVDTETDLLIAQRLYPLVEGSDVSH